MAGMEGPQSGQDGIVLMVPDLEKLSKKFKVPMTYFVE